MLCYTSKKGVLRSTEKSAVGKGEANRKLVCFAKSYPCLFSSDLQCRASTELGGCRGAGLSGTLTMLWAWVGGPMHSPVT